MGDVIPLIIKSVKTAVSTIKNSSSRAKKGMFAGVAIIAILASLSFTNTRIAYKVSYKGNIIATVSSKQQFNDALALVENMVESNDVQTVVDEPTFSTTITLSENINNTDEIANAIIDNTDAIVAATTLFVDGQKVARGEKDIVEQMVDARLNGFNVEGAECTSYFTKSITTQSGYFVASDLDDKATLESVVNSLDVVTKLYKTTDVIVPYTSTTQKTNEQVIGYSEVSVKGVSGLNRVTQDVVMLNGNVTSSVDVKTEVVIAPVNEVVLKGTAKTLASAKEKQRAHAAGFIFPLPAGTWRVSSYYGDGRNHKGVDLCAKSGTQIFAVADGKVVKAGWNGDYGYCVIIEHANGMRTLYAHAKQVCCSVGDTVKQGEVIALVGTTGQSTGNHLHFEVIVNGKKPDPAPYIGLD
ncbi:MAG: peptidoglycan DD-metalloendopeptidase family protein [Clostridia bacterium]|nr:peptidoglycan DD-metalloendopeptidase family protein [Clostridia bacterium]